MTIQVISTQLSQHVFHASRIHPSSVSAPSFRVSARLLNPVSRETTPIFTKDLLSKFVFYFLDSAKSLPIPTVSAPAATFCDLTLVIGLLSGKSRTGDRHMLSSKGEASILCSNKQGVLALNREEWATSQRGIQGFQGLEVPLSYVRVSFFPSQSRPWHSRPVLVGNLTTLGDWLLLWFKS